MKLVDHTRASLLDYIVRQQAAIVPDGREDAFRTACDAHFDEALARLSVCIDSCAPWRSGEFNVLQSSQHTIFLYYLANTIWRRSGETAAPTFPVWTREPDRSGSWPAVKTCEPDRTAGT